MPQQLIYTCAPFGLGPNRSGHCTVAHSAGMREALKTQLERWSYYNHLPSDGFRGRPIFSCRHLDIRGSLYHVLSRIQDEGLNSTGSSNFLAHHLVFTPDETSQFSSPPIILRDWNGWLKFWNSKPWLLEKTDEDWSSLPRRNASTAVPAITWQQFTGDAVNAYGLLETRVGSAFQVDDLQEHQILSLFAESLGLLELRNQPDDFRATAWQYTFTTSIQEQDNPTDFRWRCFQTDNTAFNLFAGPDCRHFSDVRPVREPSVEEKKFAWWGNQSHPFITHRTDECVEIPDCVHPQNLPLVTHQQTAESEPGETAIIQSKKTVVVTPLEPPASATPPDQELIEVWPAQVQLKIPESLTQRIEEIVQYTLRAKEVVSITPPPPQSAQAPSPVTKSLIGSGKEGTGVELVSEVIKLVEFLQAPRFVEQPQNCSSSECSFSTLQAKAEGVPPPKYQWYSVDRTGTKFRKIAGAIDNKYRVAISPFGITRYVVRATNSQGEVTSEVAVLRLEPRKPKQEVETPKKVLESPTASQRPIVVTPSEPPQSVTPPDRGMVLRELPKREPVRIARTGGPVAQAAPEMIKVTPRKVTVRFKLPPKPVDQGKQEPSLQPKCPAVPDPFGVKSTESVIYVDGGQIQVAPKRETVRITLPPKPVDPGKQGPLKKPQSPAILDPFGVKATEAKKPEIDKTNLIVTQPHRAETSAGWVGPVSTSIPLNPFQPHRKADRIIIGIIVVVALVMLVAVSINSFMVQTRSKVGPRVESKISQPLQIDPTFPEGWSRMTIGKVSNPHTQCYVYDKENPPRISFALSASAIGFTPNGDNLLFVYTKFNRQFQARVGWNTADGVCGIMMRESEKPDSAFCFIGRNASHFIAHHRDISGKFFSSSREIPEGFKNRPVTFSVARGNFLVELGYGDGSNFITLDRIPVEENLWTATPAMIGVVVSSSLASTENNALFVIAKAE